MEVKTSQNILKFFALPALIILLVTGSFFVGRMTMELELLKKGGSSPQVNSAADFPSAPSAPLTADDVTPVSESDHVRGNRDAKIALIEYSDYECPFCQRFHPTAQQVVDNYDGEVMWVYRHFPLDAIHPNATPAAIAAECVSIAGGEEAFWSFTDALFDGASLSETSLIQEASNLGLDITSCLQNEETANLVAEDVQSGSNAGVTGTPGNILLNVETGETVLIPGALPYEQLAQAIDGLL